MEKLILVFLIVFTASMKAADLPDMGAEVVGNNGQHQSEEVKNTKLDSNFKTWSYFRSYVPVKRDYGFEVGGMWEKGNLYWVGGSAGFHIGRCMFTESHTCQQYFDAIGGVGGRDGLTNGLALGSLRWQFVSYPNRYSTFARLFGGVMNIRDNERDNNELALGIGYGVAASVHKNVDLKWEIRFGHSHQPFSLTFVSINLKVDSWVEFFADKVKSLGVGTVEATGSAIEATGGVIKSTIMAPKSIYDWVVDENGKRKKIKVKDSGSQQKAPDKK